MVKSVQKKVSGADLPVPAHGFFFQLKAAGLRLIRTVKNILARQKKYKREEQWSNAPPLGTSISMLWRDTDTSAGLTAGKVHNLRLASAKLDGTAVPPDKIFSFWKQVGRPTRRKRFALGRELREGCIIPTTGGGLCQLSNAIFDAATEAGIEIVERHRHTAVIPGSLAEIDRDATVFWNYVDLRLRASFPWQLSVKMNADTLSVSILSRKEIMPSNTEVYQHRKPDALGDCTQCGRTDCYLHVGDIPLGKPVITTPECGLPDYMPWTSIVAGDSDGLRQAILSVHNNP